MQANKSLAAVILVVVILMLTGCNAPAEDLVGQAGEVFKGTEVPEKESPPQKEEVLCQGKKGPIPAEIPLPDSSANQYYPEDCKDVTPPLLPSPSLPVVQASENMCDQMCQGKKPDGSPCEGDAKGQWGTSKKDAPNPPGGCIVTMTFHSVTCYCDP